MIDITKCHGKNFTAVIHKAQVKGKVSVKVYDDKCVECYLCFNVEKRGGVAPDMLGYPYSWQCYSENITDIQEWGVSELSIIEEKKMVKEFTAVEMVQFVEYVESLSHSDRIEIDMRVVPSVRDLTYSELLYKWETNHK